MKSMSKSRSWTGLLMIVMVIAAVSILVAQTPGSGTITGGDGVVMNAAPGAGGALSLKTVPTHTVLANPTTTTAAPAYTTSPIVGSINGVSITVAGGAPGTASCDPATAPGMWFRTDGTTTTTIYFCTSTNSWTPK